jgi:hypothetical protein
MADSAMAEVLGVRLGITLVSLQIMIDAIKDDEAVDLSMNQSLGHILAVSHWK